MANRFGRKPCFLKRVLLRGALAAAIALPLADAQQQPELQFEVASIKPSEFPSTEYAAGFRAGAAKGGCNRPMPSISGTFFSVMRIDICDLIQMAYGVKGYQVVGMPKELALSSQDKGGPEDPAANIAAEAKQPAAFYDIQARAPGPNPPSAEQVREMLRSLLRDRFHLTLHRDKNELSFYALVPGKGGPKLKPAASDCKPVSILSSEVTKVCGQTMEQLARQLSSDADRTVLDMTGLSGKFDYEIPVDRSGGSSYAEAIRTGVQQHLNLRLEPRKGPIEVLVVDHVERPSQN